jgi:threonine dehydrogenase-like Zn-dependent dehydrogenase
MSNGSDTRRRGSLSDDTFDLILECTGASPVLMDMVNRLRPDGILCLTGVSSAEQGFLEHSDEHEHVGAACKHREAAHGVNFATIRFCEAHGVRQDNGPVRSDD